MAATELKQDIKISDFAGIAFDLDGVIWRGSSPISGAPEAVNAVRQRGLALTFVTNNAGQHRQTQLDKLNSMSIEATLDEVITSGSASVGYIAEHFPDAKVFVLGTDDLKQEVLDYNLTLVDSSSSETADCVVVGFDKNFNYQKLDQAFQQLQRGAKFIACNENPTYPVENRLAPGSGTIVAAVATAIGRAPDIICGKPHLPIMEETLRRLKTLPAESLFVSDSLDHDLIGAQKIGMKTLFVLSGVGQLEEIESLGIKPDFVLNSLADLKI